MITEVNQIKRHLARVLNLPIEGEGENIRVAGHVPDGVYEDVPLGASEKPTTIEIVGGKIHIP